jgi:hypothetical protein
MQRCRRGHKTTGGGLKKVIEAARCWKMASSRVWLKCVSSAWEEPGEEVG